MDSDTYTPDFKMCEITDIVDSVYGIMTSETALCLKSLIMKIFELLLVGSRII